MTQTNSGSRVILAALWIPGRARPKGSLRATGSRYGKGVRLIEDGVEATSWLRTVRNAVQVAISELCDESAPGARWLESVREWRRLPEGYVPHAGPVAVELIVMCRPLPSEIKEGSELPLHRDHGDLDKLERAIGDGLEQGGLIMNDDQISTWDARKRYVGWPGALWYPGIPVGESGAFVRVRTDNGA
jgi:Holliday junction resolvase RusA-like endonuclease